MDAPQLGHRGASFRAFTPDGASLASGELALESNRGGKYGMFTTDINEARVAKSQEAFELVKSGKPDEAVACLREVYQEVEDHWIPAEESMLNSSMRPTPFDM